MQCPVSLGAARVYLLIPELGEEDTPARMDEAARVPYNWRAIVAARRTVERARRGAAEGFVEWSDIAQWLGVAGQLRDEAAGIGEDRLQR